MGALPNVHSNKWLALPRFTASSHVRNMHPVLWRISEGKYCPEFGAFAGLPCVQI